MNDQAEKKEMFEQDVADYFKSDHIGRDIKTLLGKGGRL
jgi:hypothetical protein